MVLAQSIKFWMSRKASMPLMVDISKKFGIKDFDSYKTETKKMSDDLQKA
jgi:hypothetical protein